MTADFSQFFYSAGMKLLGVCFDWCNSPLYNVPRQFKHTPSSSLLPTPIPLKLKFITQDNRNQTDIEPYSAGLEILLQQLKWGQGSCNSNTLWLELSLMKWVSQALQIIVYGSHNKYFHLVVKNTVINQSPINLIYSSVNFHHISTGLIA